MRSYRMQAASVMLRDSRLSITEIAMQMGYDEKKIEDWYCFGYGSFSVDSLREYTGTC